MLMCILTKLIQQNASFYGYIDILFQPYCLQSHHLHILASPCSGHDAAKTWNLRGIFEFLITAGITSQSYRQWASVSWRWANAGLHQLASLAPYVCLYWTYPEGLYAFCIIITKCHFTTDGDVLRWGERHTFMGCLILLLMSGWR